MMNLPLCYHPSTLILLDDDLDYLENLAFRFNKTPYIINKFTSPHDVLNYINNEYEPHYWPHKFVKKENNLHHEYQELAINLNLYKLPLEIYNNNRFNQISCIVVDYSMPGMNGLEVLRRIKDPYIKKILLTGNADESLAIDAFNKGEIDQFVRKSDENMFLNLLESINKLAECYFSRLSITALDVIYANNMDYTALIEPKFQSLFREQLNKYNIVEYYLFESYGCYIMLDSKANTYGFFIYTEGDVKDVLSDTDIAHNWISFMKYTPKMMCYHKMINPNFPQDNEKKQYLQPAILFEGDFNKYYWAVTDKNLDIEKNDILSFYNFQRNLAGK
ncbi:MAG: response regulator [Rickettsiaceae bacterium]|jgi:FixJ family two-component response regulator|nr:response regulator [Rickettsiaceae bacterium]